MGDAIRKGLAWFESRCIMDLLDSIDASEHPTFYIRDLEPDIGIGGVDHGTYDKLSHVLSGRKAKVTHYSDGSKRHGVNMDEFSVCFTIKGSSVKYVTDESWVTL